MRTRVWSLFLAFALSPALLRADSGDEESSHDYPGFSHEPGFIITDYDEDNPAEFDFPVARPLPLDADHVETVRVKGHRYVIRYELGPGAAPSSLLQTQLYYEKAAAAAGFTVEKTGAVGDVTETFHQRKAGHDTWVHLEPSMVMDVLTIVESSGPAPPPPSGTGTATSTGPDDSLYTTLIKNGHVVLPVTFLPSKPDLGADSQPVIDRVVKMLLLHPDLLVRIEGHTDDSGEPVDNQHLSAARARAVEALLIAGGVEENRLVAVGLGGLVPIAENNTAEGREKNRRIELVVRKDSPGFHEPAPNGTNYYPNGASSAPQ